jgi:RiboL-PSP-HEPN
MPTVRSSTPTSRYSTAFLASAWKSRGELEEIERFGFGQFMYLTLCAHLESFLSELICLRFKSISRILRWDELPHMQYKVQDQVHTCDLKPVTDSLLSIISSLLNKAQNAPLSNLTESYNMIFSPKLSELLEKDLYQDLEALTKLRNLFAHGRELYLEFHSDDIESLHDSSASLNSNPIQLPTQRLHAAGIINTLDITNLGEAEFRSDFYSDNALLYFYNAVKNIEEKLFESMDFFPEHFGWEIIRPLPHLEV